MPGALTSPATRMGHTFHVTVPTGQRNRYRDVKSAPVHAHHRKHADQYLLARQSVSQQTPRRRSTRLSMEDVISLAEHEREVTSQQSRRLVLEEAHRSLRGDHTPVNRSRPRSVVTPGLQAMTSPMPSPSRNGQMDNVPALLPLPSDRPFIPSPDQYHDRHAVTTTPTEYFRIDATCSPHPVARQCCEIMGPSLCTSCRRLESRVQNRKQSEQKCPRMRSAGGTGTQTFSLTQVVKRSYPRLSDAQIQEKIASGEIARAHFPWNRNGLGGHSIDSDSTRSLPSTDSRRSSLDTQNEDSDEENEVYLKDDEEDKDMLYVDPSTYRAITPSSHADTSVKNGSVSDRGGSRKKIKSSAHSTKSRSAALSRPHITKASLEVGNAFYFLARLKQHLKGETTTPLFFSDLRGIQEKILSGTVDRKAYMTLRPEVPNQGQQGQPSRLKSAVSTISASSGKSGLSKFGSQLSREFMPAFVSPRKVKLIEEPKYKVYFEPPLLTKRRQIPNPSFFAGSRDEYSLPERLPDVIEFADSQRIAALEKQIRSGSAMSSVSSINDELQQQLSQSGDQERLTSLSLDKDKDEYPAMRGIVSSRPSSGSGKEADVGVSTPRSLHRVSSMGPLSERAVLEENEEDIQRELEDDLQNQIEDNRQTDMPMESVASGLGESCGLVKSCITTDNHCEDEGVITGAKESLTDPQISSHEIDQTAVVINDTENVNHPVELPLRQCEEDIRVDALLEKSSTVGLGKLASQMEEPQDNLQYDGDDVSKLIEDDKSVSTNKIDNEDVTVDNNIQGRETFITSHENGTL